jgi:amino-acid N-acetyltransferase
MSRAATWRIDKVTSSELKSARKLLLKSDLPTQGLEEAQLWCAKDKAGRVVGVAGLEIWGRQGLLRSVVVKAENRQGGVGKALVKRVLKEAKARNLAESYLLTETAPNFFSKFGFKHATRSSVRGNVLNSVEFRKACPDTAPMKLILA